MNTQKKIIQEINKLIMSQLWLDFEVIEYTQEKLKIIGSINPSSTPDIEIQFNDVFCISLPMEWQTDTQKEVLKIAKNEEARGMNKKFRIEQGYIPFIFTPEDYPEGFYCFIAAKSVAYDVKNVDIFPPFLGGSRKNQSIAEIVMIRDREINRVVLFFCKQLIY